MKPGWEVKALGEVLSFENGDRGKNYPGRKAFVPEGIPFINAGHIADGVIDWAAMNYIPKEHFDRISRGKIAQDDLLFCLRGSLGKFGHVTEPMEGAIASSLVILRAGSSISIAYLKYYLRSEICFEQIEKYAAGAAQPNLGATDLKKFTIPLPPLEEQKRIVAVLDAAFEGLTRARTHIETNLQNARELFEGYLAQLFSVQGENWKQQKLSTLCKRITVGFVGPMAHRYTDEGITFLRSQNVRPFQLDLNGVKFIGDDFNEEIKKSKLYPGDVAIVRTGYPGTAAVIPDTLPIANCADLVIATPDQDLSPHFLTMFLNSDFGKRMVAERSVGAAQKHFNVGAAKAVDFPTPPIREQERLVIIAAERRNDCIEIENHYRAKLQDLDDMRQSLLQKAFAGELT